MKWFLAIRTCLIFVFLHITPVSAWNEVTLKLVDPNGLEIQGVVEVRRVAGYFCSNAKSAHVIALQRAGSKQSSRDLEKAMSDCVGGVRVVIGIFTVDRSVPVFVRLYSDQKQFAYLVEVDPLKKHLLEARLR